MGSGGSPSAERWIFPSMLERSLTKFLADAIVHRLDKRHPFGPDHGVEEDLNSRDGVQRRRDSFSDGVAFPHVVPQLKVNSASICIV